MPDSNSEYGDSSKGSDGESSSENEVQQDLTPKARLKRHHQQRLAQRRASFARRSGSFVSAGEEDNVLQMQSRTTFIQGKLALSSSSPEGVPEYAEPRAEYGPRPDEFFLSISVIHRQYPAFDIPR
jgi:hypothetical protein